MLITRRLEFDAGHRIPDHKSQCRHLHGHRYAIEISLRGDIIGRPGDSANGMVMDFSEVKSLAMQHLVEQWDHAFLAWRDDSTVVDMLNAIPGHKTVLLDRVPTAENLATIAFETLDEVYRDTYGNHLQLERVRLYETPNCWADAVRGNPRWPAIIPPLLRHIASPAQILDIKRTLWDFSLASGF